MKSALLLPALLALLIVSWNSLYARSWDDLDAGEHAIYGSEREEKFPVKALFMEIEEWENHYSFMLLWLFKYTDYPKYKSTRLLPLFYGLDSKIDNRSLKVIPPLLTWLERDGDYYEKFILFPLYCSGVDSNESDRSLFWPLIWWGNSLYESRSSSYQLIIPLLWYHMNDYNETNGSGKSIWVNPLLFSYSRLENNKEDEYVWWAPIIPLLTFQNVDRYGGHRNFLMLLDYSWETVNGVESIKRFWLLPFFMRKAGSDGYTYILPPLYIHNKYTGRDYYIHLLPLFASWMNTSSDTESTLITPLFGRRRITERNTDRELYSNFFLPVIPLFYKSNDSNDGSRYCHLIPFFTSWHNSGKQSENQIVTPIFSKRNVTDSESGENIYSNFFFPIIPLFFRSNDREEGTHTNIAWLLDWKSNADGSMKNLWIAPLVFHEFKEWGYRIYLPFYARPSGCSKEDGLSFSLFHYHGWSPENDTFWAWIYYHSKDYILPEEGIDQPEVESNLLKYYRHILPLYFSWHNTDSSGRIVLPVYLNYRDRYTRLHINLTGVAVKTFTGPFNPELMLALEKKEENWFLDTDISWFYDIISFSWRTPVTGRDEGQNINDKLMATNQDNIRINKRSTNRDESVNYFGWDFLFGWMAYRHADTRYHWRVLPLAWFTYNEASADSLRMILPFYLSYYSEETKEGYFMLAPFYASQSEGESYKRGWLINLYWDEYDAAGNYREKTILWPFINWHYSPDRYGFRFFPIFWYKNWKEGDDSISRSISPLHYSMSIKDESGDCTFRRIINPAFYTHSTAGETGVSFTFFAPIIPLYYYSKDIRTGANGLEMKDSISISPLHIYSEHSVKNNIESSDSSKLMIPVLPLFYRSTKGSYSHWNFLGIVDSCRDTNYSRFFILPLFYASQEGDVKYRNILGIIDWEKGGDTDGSSMFLPFYMYRGGQDSSLTLPLLLSFFSSGSDWSTKFIAGTYIHTSPDYTRLDVLLLFDHTWYRSGNREYNEYDFLFSLAEVDISSEVWEMRAAWGILFEHTKNRKNGTYDFDALLWFAGADNENGGFHHRLMPVWYYQSYSENDWFLVVPPLLSYFSEDTSGRFDMALLGLLYYRNENSYDYEDRRHILLGIIYDEVKNPERRYHSRGSLWGLLWNYETEEQTGFTKFTILKGLYKYVDKNGQVNHTILWFL